MWDGWEESVDADADNDDNDDTDDDTDGKNDDTLSSMLLFKGSKLGHRILAGYETNNEPVQGQIHCICHRAWHRQF